MKKLIVALAVVVCAAAVQASSYNWKSAKGAVYESDSTTILSSQPTAYLFDANKFSQADLIAALFVDKTYGNLAAAATAKGITAATTSLTTAGKVSTTADFTYDGEAGGTSWSAYFAVINGDEVFVSDVVSVTASDLSEAVPIAMNSPKTASQAAALDGAKGFSTAGWYASSSTPSGVPEPTSGLLLLLGVAGLALRRKQK